MYLVRALRQFCLSIRLSATFSPYYIKTAERFEFWNGVLVEYR